MAINIILAIMKNCGHKIFITYNEYDINGGIMKRIESCICIIICLLFSNVLSVITVSSQTISTTIYVDDDNINGPWDGSIEYPYRNIQDGINASSNSDTIFVFNGTYQEHITISTKINLQGENSKTTIIEGQYQGIVVSILSDSVSISGFTIEKAGFSPYQPYPGISLSNAKHCLITNNIISTNWYGIIVDSSSDSHLFNNIIDNSYETGLLTQNSKNLILEQNTFTNRSNGMSIEDCTNLEIINNSYMKKGITIRGTYLEHWNTHTIQNNRKDGRNIYYFKNTNNTSVPSDTSQIILAHCFNMIIQNISFFDETSEFGYSDGCIQMGFSSECIINNNTILTTSNDICIHLFSCTHNSISSNHIETKFGSAIILDGSSNNSFIKNIIVKNNDGIILQNSHDNIIQDNFIVDNYRYGITIRYSTSNIIISNNLINNFHGGIRIIRSSDIAVYDNQISNGFHSSLFLDSASQIYIKNNSFLEIGGISLYYSVSISILGNSFHAEGIIITGDLKEHWNTHTIERNDINGASIKYYSNTHDFSFSEYAAQIILANATNIKIQGVQTNNIRRPLQIGFSSQNTIDKNSFLLCNDCGIYLSNSDNNIISNNILTGEESVAIGLYYCMNNLIRYNSFSYNFMGVLLHLSEENIIEKNNFQSNVIQAECEFRSPRINNFHTNKWKQNYWDDWIGVKYAFLRFLPYYINYFNFDWRPEKAPHQIPT